MSKNIKIACKDIWKLYGSNPQDFFEKHQRNPSDEAIKSEQYIPAVRNANFDVYDGEILVIMGLSGSGKSTLVRCLSRLVEPTWGKVEFDGIDLLQASEKTLIEIRRHKMGMVFQNFALLPHRTVLQNIAFPLEVQGIDKSTREEKAREIIEIVGLQGRDNYYPRELSGGQQQRVGIGRSLAVEPDIWFLDEPFSALDPLIRKEMQNEFIRLQSILGKTIVFITHDFDEAIKLADRIAIMYEGVIVQLGTAEELISNPATQYVAEFTRDIPRAKLLSVQSIMEPISGEVSDQVHVYANDSIEKVARSVLAQESNVSVIDQTDQVIGMLKRERLLETIFENSSEE
ncbi:MAG: glycine betaine/L-proline ABC transporter ATP-binding protein [Gammaproteobacteria bacterium]|nr:glycine betaine/L-proline ABC transporter ATP-binding protein [Gammaproteobacteria bacterium]MCY4218974.1 glycine betaine/L-proline ABC transporter ATP-binding protein [Gammaproteobacteria bacterium]MCY4275563.1 glycine betaine/L-proline ABC transporter ATP-binding protein [Gammaproteobacteria bacterium]